MHMIYINLVLQFLVVVLIVLIPNICQKAKRSYQKDIETFREGRDSNASALDAQEDSVEGSETSKGKLSTTCVCVCVYIYMLLLIGYSDLLQAVCRAIIYAPNCYPYL